MVIDLIFCGLMLLAVIKGFSKGLIVGIFSLLAYIIGLAAALKLSAVVAASLIKATGSGAKWLPALSFSLVFLAVVILVHLGARMLRKTAALAMVGWLDRLGGIILYIIIYTLILSVLLFFAEKLLLVKPDTIASSRVYGFVAPWGPWMIDHLGNVIPFFKDLFTQLQNFFENISHKFDA
jgi:membrane protein required for colicin V production